MNLYQIKQRKARIDTERIQNGLEPMYAAYEKELTKEQARVHLAYETRNPANRAILPRRR